MFRTVQAESGRVKAQSGHDVSDTGKVADEPTFDLALAARFRAAFAYKGMKPAAIANALGVSTRTVNRLETGRSEIDLAMQRTVIGLTGVPAWFLEYGFAPPVETGEEDLRQELNDTRDELQALLERVARIDQELQDVRAQGHQMGSAEGGQQ